jgi:DNA topoisomerase-1
MTRTGTLAPLLRDSPAAARVAELRYVSDEAPGIRRIRRGRGFVYRTASDRPITDQNQLRRIASLAIPPAWTDVWICPSAHGHIQATGRDARGRKQYRYHARWRDVRDQAKYHDVLHFAERLPKLRRRLARDVASSHLSKSKVVATVLRLMEQTFIRVGNDCYAQENGSYGLTTLKDRHAKINGHVVEFRFKGKGGKPYRHAVEDRKLAQIVKRCRDIPGQRLFQYFDEHGRARPLTSSDVNQYIKETTGFPFTAKSFRTWAGTVGATLLLRDCPRHPTVTQARKTVATAIATVADRLGNTAAICRKCYVHPAVVEAYTGGTLQRAFAACLSEARRKPRGGLRVEEAAVLALLTRLGRERSLSADLARSVRVLRARRGNGGAMRKAA